MTVKDNVIKFNKPEPSTQDFLTDLARQGAQQMIAAAIEAEVGSPDIYGEKFHYNTTFSV